MLFFLVWRRERGSSAPLDRDLGKKGAADLEDSCPLGSGDQFRRGNAVDAPDPTREMAWSAKACAHRDSGQAGSDMTNKLDHSLPSQMHDVAVRTDANESGEQPGKMERAAPRYLRAWRLRWAHRCEQSRNL